jgi:two-component system OmpR family sensor kinase
MSEESAIKLSEKESLFKSFILFFLVIELFLGFIFYHYYQIEEEHIQENIFLEMKNYSFFFKDERFNIDIVSTTPHDKFYELYFEDNNLYILVPFADDSKNILKILYPRSHYELQLNTLKGKMLSQFLWLTLLAILISFVFSFYVLSPLRNSLQLLEVFIKDIIHDLNTPLTSILINLKMIDAKSVEIKSIERSTKTISMLHHNLDAYLKEMQVEREKFDLKNIIEEQVAFFSPMHHHIEWKIEIEKKRIKSDKNTFARIIYNLLSNACRYNIEENGFIYIKTQDNILSISNSSYGIKNPSRIFERFYKENERGLGIGLHIVEKLCQQLDIHKEVKVKNNIVTIYLDLDKVTSK